jgi:hypothetical protein
VISLLEGSLVLRQSERDPNVTEVEYQYHLDAMTATHATIEGYLTTIFGRLRDRAHNRPLTPGDCPNCAAPPAGYAAP